ncbi:curli assembly protein CsgF [Eoetvoesiella caeni]|uniref:Curli production assembly/transport component CsgF n=1 Tax=Eoetvoesiella caeni TaxID=645616 RepID=A0A366HGN3_9BURK|nr:curli assembly protein CsgF [Eoetvoesiella caeni]MCI2808562.1 curli assembly protein CsgF [Eoetvoesiella caeni]NYT55102.1 curli assembly protein CsgF [Eoetvoesiella caeni]RBP40918.1 curli production assembly/transport component CsgF [Eoetvoesiella caeni]
MKPETFIRGLKKTLLAACVTATCEVALAPATASELVYFPLNPSFGGSPLNGPVLLNSAQAQNKYTDPDLDSGSAARSAITAKTPLQQFNDTLERSILNRLASNASASIMGTGSGLQPGTVETGNFVINIVDLGGGMLRITTTDKSNGTSSSFEVAS